MHWWKQFVSTTLGQIIGLRIKTQLFGKLLDLSSSRNRAFQSREQVRSHSSMPECCGFIKLSYNEYLGKACRYKVVAWLKKRFATLKDAEDFYKESRATTAAAEGQPQALATQVKTTDASVQTNAKETTDSCVQTSTISYMIENLSQLFSDICKKSCGVDVPDDFLLLCCQAMTFLKKNQRTNVLYNLAKGLGTMREDDTDTKFPIKRMPMGLIEYAANFFVAEDINQVDQV